MPDNQKPKSLPARFAALPTRHRRFLRIHAAGNSGVRRFRAEGRGGALLVAAGCVVIHLKKTELFTTVIPSKLFEFMGMGIPVLHGVAGESAEIVEREGCGQVFEPESVDALCAGLLALKSDETLRQNYRQKGLAAAGHYDRKELALRMLGEIRQCVP